ncbi:HEPN domain-containing protein [Persephonella sp. KM09-Lau-8]|uniref:HEPN domain-containing protein n=1 Tax=Persephonella sp. KM09-Lau-8 TaxID=1158345 RepID=UPI000495116E|nr:HEPN domain-containing protein [Persephonella sp. KM09-Lau-8]
MREEFFKTGEKELKEAHELLEIDFCDDGLVFFHLQNATRALLKALGISYGLEVEKVGSIRNLIELIKQKTTVKFPDWIEQIIELEEISMSDGCAASICYDYDMYGDIVEAVDALYKFVKEQIQG